MFQFLVNLFKGPKFAPALQAITLISPFLEHLEANYANDHDAKNALIDSVVQILQAHKNTEQPK